MHRIFILAFLASLFASTAQADEVGPTFTLREGYLRNERSDGGEHMVTELAVGFRYETSSGFALHLLGRVGLAFDLQSPRDEIDDRVCSGGSGGSLGSYFTPASCSIDTDWRFPVGAEAGVGYAATVSMRPRFSVTLGFSAAFSLTYFANTYERVPESLALGGLVEAFATANIGRVHIGPAIGGRLERDERSGALWYGVHGGLRITVHL